MNSETTSYLLEGYRSVLPQHQQPAPDTEEDQQLQQVADAELSMLMATKNESRNRSVQEVQLEPTNIVQSKNDGALVNAFCDTTTCENGAPCLPEGIGTEEKPCDCLDGFSGRFCETDLLFDANENDCAELLGVVCNNGGTCREDPTDEVPCDCPDGYSGRLCDNNSNTEDNEGAETICAATLGVTCENGGVCRDNATETLPCLCLENFGGRYCEEDYNELDSLPNSDGDPGDDMGPLPGDEQDGVGDEPADDPGHAYCIEHELCLNGGTCNPQSSPETPCFCLAGFGGIFCDELVSPAANNNNLNGDATKPVNFASCDTLTCQNGAKCVFDQPPALTNTKLPTILRSLGQGETTEEKRSFCQCPEGFYGAECEYRAEICGNYDHICLHGKRCTPTDRFDEKRAYTCECPATDGDEAPNSSAGKMAGVCATPGAKASLTSKVGRRSAGMTYCSPDATFSDVPEYEYGMQVPAYCMNYGVCTDDYRSGELFSRCICPHEYTGPHCEHSKDAAQLLDKSLDDHGTGSVGGKNRTNSGNPNSINPFIPLIIFVCAAALLAFVFIYRIFHRRYRNRDRHLGEPDGVLNQPTNIQDFRNADGTSNFTAKSPNGSMLFPSFTAAQREEILRESQRGIGGRRGLSRGPLSKSDLFHEVTIS